MVMGRCLDGEGRRRVAEGRGEREALKRMRQCGNGEGGGEDSRAEGYGGRRAMMRVV